MLFHSTIFLFCFLPITYTVWLFVRSKYSMMLAWLLCASCIFYAWFLPQYLSILIISIGVNYGIASKIIRSNHKKNYLQLGLVFNVLLLCWFKYAAFIAGNFVETDFFNFIILPLGISFFTFQQIAYLVDIYKENIQPYSLLEYATFVSFFPQLIAGPIVHHAQLIPQFKDCSCNISNDSTIKNFTVGLSIFIIGLSKKVIFADLLSQVVDPIFAASAAGTHIAFLVAWMSVLAFTLQIYFDFSGYTDMAIGLARMFNITLPVNFNAPYKAISVVDFWRRWHITLSVFLRDYIYIPLGGNRKGVPRQYVNLFITMSIGGLWHGASWNFVFWGMLHGIYLITNHAWKKYVPGFSLHRFVAIPITFFAVLISWVLFRAESFESAVSLYKSMIGLHGLQLPVTFAHWFDVSNAIFVQYGISFDLNYHLIVGTVWRWIIPLIIAGMMLVFFAPTTQVIFAKYNPVYTSTKESSYIYWKPTVLYGIALGMLISICLVASLVVQEQQFLYFDF